VTNALRTLALIAALLLPTLGHAQLFRAYLASDGSDANPCTLPQPCRLLPAALAAIANGGEIWMLDSANYNTGQVNITKSVTIQAIPGAIGSVVLTSAHAIFIDTPAIRVTLRNLVIGPVSGSGTDGIHVGAGAAGSTINVESCQIARIPDGSAISVQGNVKLHMVDSVLRDNFSGFHATNGTTTIFRSQVIGSTNAGVVAITSDPANSPVVHIDSSTISRNNPGVWVYTAGGGVGRAFVTRSVVSANLGNGIETRSEGGVTDAGAEVSDSVANGNGGAGLYNAGGTLRSAGNNRADGNAGGATSGTITIAGSY